MDKGYYAVIPASVRYDKRLPGNAKSLYGEITALCNEKGYCWATNKYFADLYNVSQKTISRWIKELKDCGYINMTVSYKEDSKEIESRYIRICADDTPMDKNVYTYGQKCGEGMDKNVNTPMDKNVQDNNTYINNTFNTTYNKHFTKPTLDEVLTYCNERNNTIDPQSFLDYYDSVGWKVGNKPMKDWKACVRTWEQRRKETKIDKGDTPKYEMDF